MHFLYLTCWASWLVNMGDVGTVVPLLWCGCWDLWSRLWAQRGLYSTSAAPERSVVVILDCQLLGIENHHGNKLLSMPLFLDHIDWGEKTSPKSEWVVPCGCPSWTEHKEKGSWASACSSLPPERLQLSRAPAEMTSCRDALYPCTGSHVNLSLSCFCRMFCYSSKKSN